MYNEPIKLRLDSPEDCSECEETLVEADAVSQQPRAGGQLPLQPDEYRLELSCQWVFAKFHNVW